ncbi:DUF488 domain-containing protein [Agrococcus carbonis]|uniref:DUF488 domain-containing protein n=1 Tax=Agrococcus carbonis TaxID=684552 RepID=UPI001E52C7AD|nr:DUF488 domain-containing protein [Agrococcus carbonis]
MGGERHRVRRPHHRAHRAGAAGGAIATLLTFGHGRLDGEGLRSLLTDAGVGLVVDIRRFPGSRANPAAARDAIEGELGAAGIDYRWEERLGGRRRLSAEQDAASPDGWWRVAAFRAYAAWTRTPEFAAGLRAVLDEAAARVDAGSADASGARTAVMCSEAVWWRCHRRVVADVATALHGAEVLHLMHDGSLRAHPLSETATAARGEVRWPPAPAGA